MYDELRRLAAAQHGVVARWQCRELGIDAARMRRAVRSGELVRVAPEVIRLAGAPMTDRSVVLVAVFDAGDDAVASHRTAAALWGLPGFGLLPADAVRSRARERHRPTLACLHEPRLLFPHHRTVIDGIPVTTPARTIFDLAAVLPPERTERALDNAVAKSPALLRALHRMLPELARRGRTGITVMRELLAERPAGYIAPASGLEARVIRLLAEAGIRTRRQVDLGGDDWLGRVDLVVEGTNVVVEADSARFHTSLSDRRRDAERDIVLGVAGYVVVRVTEEDAWSAPGRVVSQVNAALRRAS